MADDQLNIIIGIQDDMSKTLKQLVGVMGSQLSIMQGQMEDAAKASEKSNEKIKKSVLDVAKTFKIVSGSYEENIEALEKKLEKSGNKAEKATEGFLKHIAGLSTPPDMKPYERQIKGMTKVLDFHFKQSDKAGREYYQKFVKANKTEVDKAVAYFEENWGKVPETFRNASKALDDLDKKARQKKFLKEFTTGAKGKLLQAIGGGAAIASFKKAMGPAQEQFDAAAQAARLQLGPGEGQGGPEVFVLEIEKSVSALQRMGVPIENINTAISMMPKNLKEFGKDAKNLADTTTMSFEQSAQMLKTLEYNLGLTEDQIDDVTARATVFSKITQIPVENFAAMADELKFVRFGLDGSAESAKKLLNRTMSSAANMKQFGFETKEVTDMVRAQKLGEGGMDKFTKDLQAMVMGGTPAHEAMRIIATGTPEEQAAAKGKGASRIKGIASKAGPMGAFLANDLLGTIGMDAETSLKNEAAAAGKVLHPEEAATLKKLLSDSDAMVTAMAAATTPVKIAGQQMTEAAAKLNDMAAGTMRENYQLMRHSLTAFNEKVDMFGGFLQNNPGAQKAGGKGMQLVAFAGAVNAIIGVLGSLRKLGGLKKGDLSEMIFGEGAGDLKFLGKGEKGSGGFFKNLFGKGKNLFGKGKNLVGKGMKASGKGLGHVTRMFGGSALGQLLGSSVTSIGAGGGLAGSLAALGSGILIAVAGALGVGIGRWLDKNVLQKYFKKPMDAMFDKIVDIGFNIIDGGFEGIGEAFGKGVRKVLDLRIRFETWASGKAIAAGEFLWEKGTELWDTLGGIVSGKDTKFWDGIVESAIELKNKAKEIGSEIWTEAKEIGSEIWTEVKDAAWIAFETFASTAKDMFMLIPNAFKGAGAALKDLGTGFMKGLLGGDESGGPAVGPAPAAPTPTASAPAKKSSGGLFSQIKQSAKDMVLGMTGESADAPTPKGSTVAKLSKSQMSLIAGGNEKYKKKYKGNWVYDAPIPTRHIKNPGKGTGGYAMNYQGMQKLALQHGMRPQKNPTGGRHRKGSDHYLGRALDVGANAELMSGDGQKIHDFISSAAAAGFAVLDERGTYKSGNWTAPHLHLSVPEGVETQEIGGPPPSASPSVSPISTGSMGADASQKLAAIHQVLTQLLGEQRGLRADSRRINNATKRALPPMSPRSRIANSIAAGEPT